MSDMTLQNTNPSDTIRRAGMAEVRAAASFTPNNPQNCFVKIQMSMVATTPSTIAALMPDFITRLIRE